MKSGLRSRSNRLRLCAIALLAWCPAGAAGQAPTPANLPGPLRDHVKNERFDVVTSIRGLPLGVRDALQTLFGSQTLDIAEPGAAFQGAGPNVDPKLPMRRLIAAGCSIDHCLVYYERGGSARSWLLALFHWTPGGTRLEWGGHARAGLLTIADVRAAALSGAVEGPVKVW